ncbi:UNVERIFIED_CONTAM: hypothetical protein Sangu_0484900 [Sesamum angustifolium]|uniref:Uncharacterized protein n=1 Tax=Sesamum angustifolium TaxID=2727405 RepID=A0AAW2Q7Y7_9LAMI
MEEGLSEVAEAARQPRKHYDRPRVELSRSRVILDNSKAQRSASRAISHDGVPAEKKMWTPPF